MFVKQAFFMAPVYTPKDAEKGQKKGMVQINQIPGNIICGFIGFWDGCTALRVLPSPSCA
jgi:hypothetical protein